MYYLRPRLLMFSAVLAANLSGCTPESPREVSEVIVSWDRLGTIVIAVQSVAKGASRYLLEGEAAMKVTKALRENTVAEAYPSRGTQLIGAALTVCAFDQDGGQLHRFFVDLQGVEGMGGKNNRNPRAHEGQRKRRLSVLTLVEEGGRPLSTVQFEQYAQQFEHIGCIFLYWKN